MASNHKQEIGTALEPMKEEAFLGALALARLVKFS